MSKSVLHLDLHTVAKNSAQLQAALDSLFLEAEEKRVKKAEIIPGKGTGQLMKRVKRYLELSKVKEKYKRYDVDANNHGRLFVYFR